MLPDRWLGLNTFQARNDLRHLIQPQAGVGRRCDLWVSPPTHEVGSGEVERRAAVVIATGGIRALLEQVLDHGQLAPRGGHVQGCRCVLAACVDVGTGGQQRLCHRDAAAGFTLCRKPERRAAPIAIRFLPVEDIRSDPGRQQLANAIRLPVAGREMNLVEAAIRLTSGQSGCVGRNA